MHLSPEMLSRRCQPTRFNVVIRYEDFGTGRRAKKGLDYVAEELGNDLEFRQSMWRLGVLEEPKLHAMVGRLDRDSLDIINELIAFSRKAKVRHG